MREQPYNTVTHLSDNQPLPLRDAKGILVQCHRGTVWITQHNDSKDVIMHAGQSFEIERQGLTLVTGFEGAAVSIVKPGEPAFLSLRAAPYVV
jgi:Protein of unknown function (DUF2917)